MRKLVILGLIVVCLTSCTTGKTSDKTKDWHGAFRWTGLMDQQKLDAANHWAIDSNVDFYVAIPLQEVLDDTLHTELSAQFRRYYPKTRAAINRETLQQSLVSAKYAGMDYLAYPTVQRRVKRKGFDMVSSKEIDLPELQRPALDMDILIYSVNSGNLIDRIQLFTKGGIFNPSESSLLWPPLNDYLKKISQFSSFTN